MCCFKDCQFFLQEVNCKSKEHFAASHALFADILRAKQDHERELRHLEKATVCHQFNSTFWLRIAECFGFLSSTDIYSPSFKLSPTKDFTWHAAACVIRADMLLKSVSGGPDSNRKKRSQKSLKTIQPIICNLPHGFVSKAREVFIKINTS